MVNTIQVFFAVLFGLVFGIKELVSKTRYPVLSMSLMLTVFYLVLGMIAGYSPLSFVTFTAEIFLMYAVVAISSCILNRVITSSFNHIKKRITRIRVR
jgi:hypothetical protein